MKLAEALLRRKEFGKRLSDLQSEIYGNLTTYEGEEGHGPEIDTLLQQHEELSTALYRLTVNINHSNNATASGYNDLSLMEAIAYRDSLLRTSHLFGSVVTQLGSSGYGGYGGRRTKDDLKVVNRYDKKLAEASRNAVAEELHRLEVAIQTTNWTAELQEID